MRLIDWNLGNLGQQDRSLKAAAVYAPLGTIVVVKNAIPDDLQLFEFASTTLGGFTLVDDGVSINSNTFSDLDEGIYDVAETVPAWWDLTSIAIDDPSGGSSSSGSTANIDLAAGEIVTVTFTNEKLGVKGGYKYDDADGDGFWDVGEPALEGWSIHLKNASTGEVIETVQTDAEGYYEFPELGAGSYTVNETLPDGWVCTEPGLSAKYEFTVTSGYNETDDNFGNSKTGVKSGTVYEDVDGDGSAGMNIPRSGWEIRFYKKVGDAWVYQRSGTTDGSGGYEFTGLEAGWYKVNETLKNGWISTGAAEYEFNVTSGFSETGNDFYNFKLGVKGGYKLEDVTGDGLSSDDYDYPLSGWTIELVNSTGHVVDTNGTDGDGYYEFTGLEPGNYTVREVLKGGWMQTYPESNHTFTVTSGFSELGNNFTNKLGSIGDYVWHDEDRDKIQDAGETGIANITIALYYRNGTLVTKTETNGSGWYLFEDLMPGSYVVDVNQIDEDMPDTFRTTTANDPLHHNLSAGENYLDADFGYASYSKEFVGVIGDYVWHDKNWNGIMDDGDTSYVGLSFISVSLYDKDGNWLNDTETDFFGIYAFPDMPAGLYIVKVNNTDPDLPHGSPLYVLTGQGVVEVNLTEGALILDADFGFAGPESEPASVSGVKFNDLDEDGEKDGGEPGLEGWTVELLYWNETLADTTTTNASGHYLFTGILGGLYIIEETLQEGWTQTYPGEDGAWLVFFSPGDSLTGYDFGNFEAPHNSSNPHNPVGGYLEPISPIPLRKPLLALLLIAALIAIMSRKTTNAARS